MAAHRFTGLADHQQTESVEVRGLKNLLPTLLSSFFWLPGGRSLTAQQLGPDLEHTGCKLHSL
jgi:hypothetical protein